MQLARAIVGTPVAEFVSDVQFVTILRLQFRSDVVFVNFDYVGAAAAQFITKVNIDY